MSFSHDHGFDLRDRRRRRLALTAVAVITVALASGWAVVRLTDDSARKPLGRTLKVGYNQGSIPQSAIVKYVARETDKAHGIRVVPVPVNDANQVNGSTADGDLAANITQHAQWLKVIVANEGYEVKAVEPLFTQSFAVYSRKYDSLRDLPRGATVTIPNDPSNQSQALLVLKKAGLVRIDKDVDPLKAQIDDVSENPKRLRWHQVGLDAISRSITDVDAAVNYAYKFRVAKIPEKQRILLAKPDERFAIQLVTAGAHARDDSVTRLRKAFTDKKVDDFIARDLDEETRPARHTTGTHHEEASR
ncbi:hypothetical protein HCC61_26960 [Streptomyces sp. HNM0575]|uniref:MetQ/NlpA family ABC transporter substrate-binding protein n=1 Tax=Streptomyces sp. HNM0575 TaxID=2716338 RepID=UPI00145C5FED|nr:MetQ/NlpA family ABC transporter substrate-binding protein [Streptomyces sp. HNM0575]NLU76237.1 hypothetical protein [Streptomyces sp. HNM0575]